MAIGGCGECRLCWVSKGNAFTRKPVDDGNADVMPRLKHNLHIIAFDVENEMEIERACGKVVEPRADKLRAIVLDDFAQNFRDPLRKGGRGLVYERQNEGDPAVERQRVVRDFLLKQFAVRNDLLFTRQRTQPCAFHADDFDPGDRVVIRHRVAAAEWLIKNNRYGSEQVGENPLGSKANGNAANAKAGDKASDVNAEIVKNDDCSNGEQSKADEQPD